MHPIRKSRTAQPQIHQRSRNTVNLALFAALLSIATTPNAGYAHTQAPPTRSGPTFSSASQQNLSQPILNREGRNPSALNAPRGIGTMSRKLDLPAATNPLSTTTVLHNFTIQQFGSSNNIDGIPLSAPLVLGSDGNFYGVAQSGGPNGTGTIFKVTRTGVLTMLLAFDSGNVNDTGANPSGALIEDTASPGTFYGTTQSGGANASGIVFKLVTTTSPATETILHSFGDSGTPNDGLIPAGALALRGGVLYGTTAGGGANGNAGTIYKIGVNGTGYATLHNFTSASDGSNPRGLVLGSTLCGVTQFGGPNGAGTVWSLGTGGSGFKVLYGFGGSDGYSEPALSLALAGDGSLYGSFGVGTPDGYGGIYKISSAGTFSLLHAFVYNFDSNVFEGGWPGPIILGIDGNLYGQLGHVPFNMPTNQFNPSPDHQHFQIRTSDGGLTVLPASNSKEFQGYGESALTAAPDGTLYALESSAGATGYGDVLQLRPAPVHILTVSSTNDDINSSSDPTTLRGAINAAQPGDSIVFSPSLEGGQNTITLTQGELFISQDLNIDYAPTNTDDSLTIDANGLSRVFHISGGIVDISGLTIANGFVQDQGIPELASRRRDRQPRGQPGSDISNTSQGGGILIDGASAVDLSRMTISHCVVTTPEQGEGGGLCLASGNLTLSNSTITNCSATTGGGVTVDCGPVINGSAMPGGALLNYATLDGCKAMEGGGLAIESSGPVGMFFGTITNNQAGGNGGGVYDLDGRTVIDNTSLSNNLANGVTVESGAFIPTMSTGSGAGGALYNAGASENLDNDVVSSNTAYSGGAIDIAADDTEVQGYSKIYFTTLSGNTASFSSGSATPGPLNGDGGAITVDGGSLDLLQSTVGGAVSQGTAGNHADKDGGGIYLSSGTATINDITFYGNVAAGRGGAVFNSASGNSDITLYYCTITGNDAALGGGLFEDFNPESDGNAFTVSSAIVAQNTLSGSSTPVSGQDAAVTAGGAFTSNGSNLIGNGDGAIGLDQNGIDNDQVGNVGDAPVLDPMLFPLANYGGTTLTRALKPGSPALKASFNIDDNLDKYDQRGVQRPYPNPYDIGAAEHPAPHAGDDFYAAVENTALVIPAPGVLSDDYADFNEQPNPYPLTALIASQPSNGHVTLNADGSFTYTPQSGFVGTDSFTYNAEDPISASSLATVTINVSGAAPTTTASLTGTLGNNSYYRSAVTVTLSATDTNYSSTSLTTTYSVDGGAQQTYYAPGGDGGPAAGTGPFVVSHDGTHTVTFSSTDPDGGAETLQSVTIKIDATAPTLAFGAASPAPNASGYTKSPVSIPYTARDATSGVASSSPGSPIQFTSEGAHQTRTVTVTDKAGNSATFTTAAVSIDLTPPVTSATTQTTTTGERVTLSAVDLLSGVANTIYSVDGGASKPYAAPFIVMGNGSHTVTFHSVDRAGNIEANKTTEFAINIAAPMTTATLTGPLGKNGYYTGPVTVKLTATSMGSTIAGTFYSIDGGALQSYTAPFTITGDGAHTVSYDSKDGAGNAEAQNQQSVKIDSTPPVTTASLSAAQSSTTAKSVPRANATSTAFTGPVTITLTATDNLSGVDVTTYALDSGQTQIYAKPFVVSAAGQHILTFGSADRAGNTETAHTLTFTISSTSPHGVLHTFTTGLQLFSVPKNMSEIPLSQAFSQPNITLAVWVPTLIQYILSPTPPADALRPGQGYWARFGQNTALYDPGTPTPTGTPFPIPIRRGWNMIGDPFPGAVSASSLRVQTTTGIFSLNDSVAKILLLPTIYSYDPGAGQYQTHNLSSDSLQPYVGYWLYSRCDGNLLVSAP